MSAQEREALVRELVTLFGPGTFGSGAPGPELYEFEAERIADALLAAGWARPVPAAREVEATTEDVIERVTDVIDREGYWPKPDEGVQEYADRIARALAAASLLAPPVREPEAGTLRIEGHWLVREVNEHTCGTGPGGHYGAHEPGCGLIPEVDLSTLPDWRSEAEIKAEALREAAEAMRLAKEPGHRYLLDLLDADVISTPDVRLERRAARLAKEADR